MVTKGMISRDQNRCRPTNFSSVDSSASAPKSRTPTSSTPDLLVWAHSGSHTRPAPHLPKHTTPASKLNLSAIACALPKGSHEQDYLRPSKHDYSRPSTSTLGLASGLRGHRHNAHSPPPPLPFAGAPAPRSCKVGSPAKERPRHRSSPPPSLPVLASSSVIHFPRSRGRHSRDTTYSSFYLNDRGGGGAKTSQSL